MIEGGFDWEALTRALILGMGIGLVVSAIASFLRKWPQNVLVRLGIGVALIIAVVLFYTWPSLIKVPDITRLSHHEAEDLLVKKGLVSDVTPQYHQETEPGRVIPHSQDPLPGIKVRRRTVVKFAVAVSTLPSKPSIERTVMSRVSVSLFRPKSRERVHCIRYADGVYRFSVVGTASGLPDKSRLLLWVRPVRPPSETPGWYLQRPPVNGIGEVKTDGSWQGIAQIGNVQWPPRAGDVLDLAVTLVDAETANRLLAEPGVVTHINLPGIASDIASTVIVELS